MSESISVPPDAAPVPTGAARPPSGAARAARQPFLHEHVTCVRAPALWISPAHGDLRGGVDGLYVADRRALSRLRVTVDGAPGTPLSAGSVSAWHARFTAVAPVPDDPSPDPTTLCERDREVWPDGGVETLVLRNASRSARAVRVEVVLGTDLAAMGVVKSGGAGPALPASVRPDGLCWRAEDGAAVTVVAEPAPVVDGTGRLCWDVQLPPRGRWRARLRVRYDPPARAGAPGSGPTAPAGRGLGAGASTGRGFRPTAPAAAAPWASTPLVLRAADRRADELVRRGVADLDALRLVDPLDPADQYFAAGSPWYLTLFGRDALWSALLALPLGAELLAGTLRTLARRQGRAVDAGREEAPGKILHEVRPDDAAVWLPPVYYGTVDATPLFVVGVVEAWRWGLPEAQVAALLPAVERALSWLATHGDVDGDGLVEDVPAGHGLVNQGWKDSRDGVQWADGRLAQTPLALCEVQGYAYRAATGAAALLDAYGRPGGERWRDWARRLAERFRSAYWVGDADGDYPAIALDAAKRPVDGPASNMGHLLGTGLLDAAEERAVARRLLSPAMASGYGLRTLADTAAGYNPLSYHVGSVWPHDTAVAALGLARAGLRREAGELLAGLLAAAAHFDYRLPELYGGQPATPPLPPVPYPASCRPQAWAAAVGPALVRILLGIEADAPGGRVTLAPVAPSPVGAYEVHGVRVAGGELAVRVDEAGRATVLRAPAGVRVHG
jgi:glycogen debranching enzyme